MKKLFMVLLVAVLVSGSVTVFAGETSSSSGEKEGFWQSMYDGISSWGK